VRPPYDEAWRRFHEGLATDLVPDLACVHAWCITAVGRYRDAAPLSPPELPTGSKP
jgi:hypothetical protein